MKKGFKLMMAVVAVTAMLCGTLHPVSSSVGAKIIEPEKNLTGKKLTYYTSGSFLYSLEDGEATICGYLGDGTTKIEMDTLVIPSEVDGYPVTKIGNEAFAYNCTVLADGTNGFSSLYYNRVVIPNGVRKIGDDAFRQTSMKEVKLPDGLEIIESGAFNFCDRLKEIKFPNSLKKIGQEAYYGCKKIDSITVPEGVTKIEKNTFAFCENLDKVKLHENLKSIAPGAFQGCDCLGKLEIPNSVTRLGSCIVGLSDRLDKPFGSRDVIVKIRSMNIFIDENAFWDSRVHLWVYPGSEAIEEISEYETIEYMKPDISTKKLKVKKGEATPLVMYGARKKVKWHIEDKSVVKLVHYGGKDRNVTVKGKKKGSTTVTATYKGKTYSCKVVVK